MAIYDQAWCDSLAGTVGSGSSGHAPMLLLYVITDTEEGKVAFNLELDKGGIVAAAEGKFPRGTKADVTVTVKEPVIQALWAGERTRDEAFMAGDLKIEGAYERWLDELVPLFEAEPWSSAWAASITS